MIEARLVSAWGGLVGSAALIALIILALGVMVGAVKREDVLRRLGVIVGVVILLIVLPQTIVSLWNLLTLGQHLGIAIISIVIIFLFSSTQRRPPKAGRREGSS